MPELATTDAPQAAPPAVVDAAATTAAEPSAQTFQDADTAADSLFNEYVESTKAPLEATEESEPKPEIKEPDEPAEEAEAAGEPAAEADDPFAEFEPKRLLTDEEIDAKFNRVPKDARAELKEYAKQVRELEAQLEAGPSVPEYIAPITSALDDVIDTTTATPQDWARADEHADNILETIAVNPAVHVKLANKLLEFAWANNPNALNMGLEERLGTTEDHVRELLDWEKAGMFDPTIARDEFQDHLKSVQPAVIARMEKAEARTQHLESQLRAVLEGSNREKQQAAQKFAQEHNEKLLADIMTQNIKPLLTKVGWDKIDGFEEVYSDWAEKQVKSSPEFETLTAMAEKNQLTSTEYTKALDKLVNKIKAKHTNKARQLDSGLSTYKRPAIKSQSAAKEAKEAPVGQAPPVAKAEKPRAQMSADEIADQYFKDAVARGVRL